MLPRGVTMNPDIYSGDVSLTHNLVPLVNKARVHLVPISDIKVTVPTRDNLPQSLECLGAAIAFDPGENA